MAKQEKHFYEFGPFRLDPVKRRLLHNGDPLPLAPKAFDTLLALVQQSSRTIEKDDLMKKVWPDALVEENNLNQNITALRKSLGDSRQEGKYVATNIWMQPLAGGAANQLTDFKEEGKVGFDWSRDGRQLFFCAVSGHLTLCC